jgi:hypothetical protein
MRWHSGGCPPRASKQTLWPGWRPRWSLNQAAAAVAEPPRPRRRGPRKRNRCVQSCRAQLALQLPGDLVGCESPSVERPSSLKSTRPAGHVGGGSKQQRAAALGW